MNTVTLPQLAWYEAKKLELPLPDSWQVELYNMAGYNRPAMKPDEIKTSITNLIGTAPIRELAKGKNEVVIIFDDMSRVTRVAEILPFVLEELAQAGIPDNKIRFICALGCHGAPNRLDWVKKLGEEILTRFPVYNHCPFMNCTYIGTTSYGTKVSINAEVMSCDLKISIGQITAHVSAGFSGGGKIILPGVASYDTVVAHHGITHEVWRGKQVKITEAVPVARTGPSEVGRVMALSGREAGLGIGTGDGILGVLRVQLEGKRAMSAAEFLRGQRDFIGTILPS